MSEEISAESLKEYVAAHKHWNGGAGLIVSPSVGAILMEYGIKEGEGYSIARPFGGALGIDEMSTFSTRSTTKESEPQKETGAQTPPPPNVV